MRLADKYKIVLFGLMLSTLKEQEYIVNGRFNREKAKRDREHKSFWQEMEKAYNELNYQIHKIKWQEYSRDADKAIFKMTEDAESIEYVMIITMLKLADLWLQTEDMNLSEKMVATKLARLSEDAIDVLRPIVTPKIIRNSLILAKIISEWIETGKLINYKLRVESKASWAKKA